MTEQIVFRFSPVQTALLVLVACPCAAVNLYAHPSLPFRVITLAIGLVSLAAAVLTYRMYLVVDTEGVALRKVRHEQWLPWKDIERSEIAGGVRGAETIRFVRHDGTSVDVPPSLLQPTRPTAKPAAHRRLRDVLNRIESRRPS